MLDHAFRRRKEIERMMLSGKRLIVAELMRRYCVGRKSISRDFKVIGEELPVISKQGYNGGYFLMNGVGKTRIRSRRNNWNAWRKSLFHVRQRTGILFCQSYMNSGRTAEDLHRK